ncbi:MAG: sodium:solute symporter, partial [Pedobacter sp.]
AYIVNDIYLKYVKPGASTKQIMTMNYLTGIIVVIVGVFLGFFAKDVNSILQWIVSGLYGGYIAANVLKWYWWRFNANGFFWGMVTGIAGALVFSHFFSGIEFLYYFPVLFAISIAGCLIGTYSAPATDITVLKHFYSTVRPWGFWQPVHDQVVEEQPDFVPNTRFSLDMFNVVLGIAAQLCLTVLPMYLILWMKLPLLITIGLVAVIAVILKRTWWDKLEN